MIWFTSDLHLGHANIIRYCNRPYQSVAEQDGELILRWNERVQNDDEVYVVGDFALTSSVERLRGWLQELHGKKHLVIGNHDRRYAQIPEWASARKMVDLRLGDADVTLCHYRLLDWRSKNGWLLHGHSHSQNPVTGARSYDVGVDGNGYRPVTFDEILATYEKGSIG